MSLKDEKVIERSLAWAEAASGLKWSKVELPKATAGQNKVLMLTSSHGSRAVLRVTPAAAPWARSGVWIKERLLGAGFVVPKEMTSTRFDEFSVWASLLSVVPGEDLACCWQSITESQALVLACAVGHLVSTSFELFEDCPPDGSYGRFAPPKGLKSNQSKNWLGFCQEWLDWAGRNAQSAGQIDAGDLLMVQEVINKRACSLSTTPIRAFVWDTGDRNVMVSGGRFSGLVDQDELMMGDPWCAPALALSQLSIRGVPWARSYALSWAKAWGGTEDDVSNMSLYAALWAIQIAAKAGKVLPDGRQEPAIPAGVIRRLCEKL